MLDFIIVESDDEDPNIDFSFPEDVIFEVVGEGEYVWSNYSIESTTILNGEIGVTGAASYENSYGGFLDYTIGGMIDCPGEGWWVMEGITAAYSKGDGWLVDDDMGFAYTGLRAATSKEILQA